MRDRLRPGHGAAPPAAEAQPIPGELVAGAAQTIRLHPEAVERFGLKTADVRKAAPPQPLVLPGTLLLDTNHFVRVRSRFAGDVVEVCNPDGTESLDQPSDRGPIRLGDPVKRNQLLAVIWSKDLGEKKSELVDALSRWWLDQETVRQLQETRLAGAMPERNLREAERNVEADRVAVDRARRTLRSWRLAEEEIQSVEREARQLFQRAQPGDRDDAAKNNWARVEVRAPFRGVVVEANVTKGDVVDTTLDLFKIADLSRLRVAVHAPEEDITVLQQLRPEQRLWNLRLQSGPEATPLRGTFDQIGLMIDPGQRTTAVTGSIENPEDDRGERKLRVGQLVLAEIPLPAPDDEVVVPRTALVEMGRDWFVVVQPEPTVPQYVARKVALVRRGRATAHVRAVPTAEDERQGCKSLAPGERVVTAGTVELMAVLNKLSTRDAE
jgi:cobalt-zinc-cadmium efflux system membrane fusion protein